MLPTLVLVHEFRPDVRGRGEMYVRTGRVRIVEGAYDHVSAIVEGSEFYDVLVTRTQEEARVRFGVGRPPGR